VLLVEDHAGIRAMVVRVLSNHGYRVLEASNGPDAIILFDLHTSAIDLLITDVVMPGMSGKSVAERARRARPDLPVLLISGHAYDVLGADPSLGDGSAFLPKPFSEALLLAAVQGLLDAAPKETKSAAATERR
jgi:CheY-like chemotaxis protein